MSKEQTNQMLNRLGKHVTELQLRRWAEAQIMNGVPRQKVCADVMAKFDHSPPNFKNLDKMQKITEHNRACLNVESAIMQTMIDRDEEARQLEKSGKTERAIALFEESVRDQFLGTLPYERLRIIYFKLKRYEDAIRVCQAYVDNPYLKGAGKTKGRQEFREKIRKIKEKMK